MKTNDVPQDMRVLIEGEKINKLMYAVVNDG